MAKDLIIGAMTNYNFEQIRPWVKSIEQSGFTGDKVMIVFNSSYETIEKLMEHKFDAIVFGKDDEKGRTVHQPFGNLTIHLERFLHIYNYLNDNDRWKEYDRVITTDVKDVVFQSNPSTWLDSRQFSEDFLFCGSESLRYKDEPWGSQNLLECYGPFIHERFKNKEIFNVGVLAGGVKVIRDLALNIFLNGINRPIPIVDQAVFNMLVHTEGWDCVSMKMAQKSGFALHAGTTVDPSKIDQFRPHLLEDEPTFDFERGLAISSNGEPFLFLHQYDRVPEWKKVVESKYV